MNLKTISNISSATVIRIVLYGFLLTGLYHSTFLNMIGRWDRPEYNYCYFIPLVVLCLVWEKRKELTTIPSQSSWNGMLSITLGLGFFFVGELGGEYLTLYISFWLFLIGLSWIHLGWEKLKTIAFALFMILTMFPLPDFLYNKISVKLQLISSKLGVSLMQLYGMSAHREGNIIDLAFTKLQVVEACSGLRSLMSLTVLGLLMAYFFRATLWKRAFLLISVIPISICTNSIRLALTGILHEKWGAQVADGFFHGFSGWVIFCLAFAILLIEMWILKKVGKPPPMRAVSPETVVTKEKTALECPTSNVQRPTKKHLQGLLQPHFILVSVLLTLTIVISQGVEFREKIPINKPLDTFPLNIREWKGTRHKMAQHFIESLDLSDYAIINYRNTDDKTVNLYVAYYESQRKGESIHSPATCLPGSGWIFANAGAEVISTPGHYGGSMKVNRAFMKKPGHRQLSYYWFPQRGRILNNAYQLKLFVFWDALTKQRTDGALVRLIIPVGESEDVREADQRMQEFVRLVVPALEEYIPGKTAN